MGYVLIREQCFTGSQLFGVASMVDYVMHTGAQLIRIVPLLALLEKNNPHTHTHRQPSSTANNTEAVNTEHIMFGMQSCETLSDCS